METVESDYPSRHMPTKTVTISPLESLQSALCYCGMKLHSITYGGQDWLQCPSHGSAYKEDAEKKIVREMASQ